MTPEAHRETVFICENKEFKSNLGSEHQLERFYFLTTNIEWEALLKQTMKQTVRTTQSLACQHVNGGCRYSDLTGLDKLAQNKRKHTNHVCNRVGRHGDTGEKHKGNYKGGENSQEAGRMKESVQMNQ